eukprot:TRINITY_DN5347_c0_g1_i1.p1 TRINITY_DN5347_c0_g1~~TRINITY_DN5347_c0_g1_i1.p1  ORF type:complete len:413 (-),score=115.22 TRINITY_DN5347_c0_g1_i1:136-1287(-)
MPRNVETAALALGTCLLAERLFVPAAKEPRAPTQSPALRGAPTGAAAAEEGGLSVSAALGVTGALTAVVSAGRRARTARQAEPVSAAAAAAAAAKAAGAAKAGAAATGAAKAASAAKGAVKAGAAISGSAGAGSLKKSADDADFEVDQELADKKMKPQDRGSAEYKAYMDQRRKQKETDWEVRTDRNADGNFGTPTTRKPGDPYDPLLSMEGNWQQNTSGAGIVSGEFNPAFAIGVTEPLGYFDPAGFCKVGNEEGFRQYRTAEIKHGRVAMMAAVGAVVQHYVKLPGFEKVPAGLAAVNDAPGSYGAIALFLACGALELTAWSDEPNKEPGNFGDPLGLNQYTDEMRNREINNGRAAMFAALGIIAAELYTGKDAIEQLGFK